MQKILLTHAYFIENDAAEQAIMKPYVPLGILSISAFLEKYNIPNSVFDSTFSSLDKLKAHLIIEKPDLLCIYVNLMTRLNVLKIIELAKNTEGLKDTKILLGGPETRYHKPEFINAGADFIIAGEGENCTLELVLALQNNTSLTEVKGLTFRLDEGEIIENPEPEKIKNIDELPFPAREKVDLEKYFQAWSTAHGYTSLSVNTMRGCPYTCKWCSRSVYGLSYRRRSPDRVVEELLYIKSHYNPTQIWFVDDVFTISHNWLTEFSEKVNNVNAVIPYECISRSDRLNEKVMQLLKKSGCFRIWIGAESGSQSVIDLMDRRISVKHTKEMIKLAKKHNMEAGTFIMLGYPGEKEKDIFETVEYLKDSMPDQFTITIAYPIKGTPLFEEVESSFTYSPEWSSGTDRDIDFKRTYSRPYYNYAVRFVNNEVNAHKAWKNKHLTEFIKLKLKSIFSRSGMWYWKVLR